MYIPAHFAESDPEKLAAVLSEYNFGTLITAGPQGLFATHLAFVPDPARPLERLYGHMARANPHWRDIDDGIEALAIFQGPHAYVSPAWYRTGPRVPTWNYIAVHVYGRVHLRTRPDEVLETLALTVQHQEEGRPKPWRMADLPKGYAATMAKGVVAIEFAVSRMEGKFKLSQNVPRADQEGALAGLLAEGDALSQATAEAMRLACGLAGDTTQTHLE